MTYSEKGERMLARMERAKKRVDEGDPRLWRHPLAQATVALLEEGSTVTVDSLIARLEVMGADDQHDVLCRRASSQAAIDLLRKLVFKKD